MTCDQPEQSWTKMMDCRTRLENENEVEIHLTLRLIWIVWRGMTLVLDNPTVPVVAVMACEADRGRMQDALPTSLQSVSCQLSTPNSTVTAEDPL